MYDFVCEFIAFCLYRKITAEMNWLLEDDMLTLWKSIFFVYMNLGPVPVGLVIQLCHYNVRGPYVYIAFSFVKNLSESKPLLSIFIV